MTTRSAGFVVRVVHGKKATRPPVTELEPGQTCRATLPSWTLPALLVLGELSILTVALGLFVGVAALVALPAIIASTAALLQAIARLHDGSEESAPATEQSADGRTGRAANSSSHSPRRPIEGRAEPGCSR